jgi:hypothetical protein
MTWHSVELSSEQLANNEHEQIQQLFEQLFINTGAPTDVAMFSADHGDNKILYFSPGTSEIVIRVARARPSSRPPLTATLCVGHRDALYRLQDGRL